MDWVADGSLLFCYGNDPSWLARSRFLPRQSRFGAGGAYAGATREWAYRRVA
jgi:hypothetical protein